MNKWAEILVGQVIVIGVILITFYSQPWRVFDISLDFWSPAWDFFKGGLVWFILLIGVLFILLGLSDLRG